MELIKRGKKKVTRQGETMTRPYVLFLQSDGKKIEIIKSSENDPDYVYFVDVSGSGFQMSYTLTQHENTEHTRRHFRDYDDLFNQAWRF